MKKQKTLQHLTLFEPLHQSLLDLRDAAVWKSSEYEQVRLRWAFNDALRDEAHDRPILHPVVSFTMVGRQICVGSRTIERCKPVNLARVRVCPFQGSFSSR